MGVEAPTHKNQHTGDATLDRIQNNVRDLIAYVRSLLWMTRRTYVALGTDTGNVAAAAYATLLTTTLTTSLARSFLIIHLSASGIQITNAGTVFFQVLVDGAIVKGCYTTVPATYSFGASMVVRIPVTQGLHTVILQWKTNVNSAHINALSTTEEHAAMSIHEEAA